MLGLIAAIILFNLIAFATNKRLTRNQIVHIWMFTIAFQVLFDTYIDAKYHGYWYFYKEIDLKSIPAITVLIPPVNMMFLNWYPLKQKLYKQLFYILCWVIAIILYECVTLLPEPWGYYNYGWWRIYYSVVVDPVLFVIVVVYYKWICKIEKLN